MLHMDITHSFAATKQLNEKEKVKSWHRKGRTHLPQNQKKSRDRIPNIPWVYHLAQKKTARTSWKDWVSAVSQITLAQVPQSGQKKNCRGAPTCWPLASPLRGLRCPASVVQEPSGHLVWWSSESYPRKKRTSTRVLRLVWNLGLNWNSSRSFGQLALGSWKTHPFRPVTTSFFPRGTSHSNGMNDLPSESWDFPELMKLMRGCSSLHWSCGLDGPDKASSERRLLLRWNIIGPIMRMKVPKNNHSGVWQQSP
jgi:hypothetical protein